MKTGRVWAGTIDDIPVQVVYTRHFADRFDKDEGDRPAVARYVDEPEILEVITDALPGITDKWRSIWDHSGVINSRSRDLNMSFITETDDDGMTVVMKNMMLKHVYQPHSEDYMFAVAGFEMGDGSPHNYIVMFKRSGSKDPNPRMSDGWFSIAIEAGSEEQAKQWALYRAEMLNPWLKDDLEFVHVEIYHPTPELAGPYRGLIVNMD